jgi:3-phenylpropionate/cinnamic acid dioxygenase small subunit
MFKLEINIADYEWIDGEKVVVETSDFEKAQVILEFIEFQKDFDWSADYEMSDDDCEYEEDEEEESEEEEYEEYEIGEIYEDEDGLLWKRVA